jgi:hypothetical protein
MHLLDTRVSQRLKRPRRDLLILTSQIPIPLLDVGNGPSDEVNRGLVSQQMWHV